MPLNSSKTAKYKISVIIFMVEVDAYTCEVGAALPIHSMLLFSNKATEYISIDRNYKLIIIQRSQFNT
jgi:hypothetical protein